MSMASVGWANGVSWGAVKAYVSAGWREALAWPALAWLSPQEPVKVLHADGSESVMIAARANTWRPCRGSAVLCAIELPEQMLLRRQVALPWLADADLARVIEQEVVKSSPFGMSNTVWGYALQTLPESRVRVDYVVVARDAVQAYLDSQSTRVGRRPPEVWAGGEHPISLGGFGEGARQRRLLWRRCGLLLLLVCALMLAGLAAASSTIKLRARAIQASMAYDILQHAAAPHVKMRDQFQTAGSRLDEAIGLTAMPVEPVSLLETLSKLLSDDEWVSELRLNGNVVQITGEAVNASRLMQTLGEQAAFKEVKALGTSVKNGGRESFSFEFKVTPVPVKGSDK